MIVNAVCPLTPEQATRGICQKKPDGVKRIVASELGEKKPKKG
jgi:hypothetical protein